MPLPRWLARFNRRGTNRLLHPLVTRLPGWGEVLHVGRRTGRPYRTPVIFFRCGDRVVVALNYGSEADWVRNVLARGGCSLATQGRVLRLGRPRVVRDGVVWSVPPPVRAFLALAGTAEVLELVVEAVEPSGGLEGEADAPRGAIG